MQEHGSKEGATTRAPANASAVGSPSVAHRDKRERVFHPSSPPTCALGDGLPSLACGERASPSTAQAQAGEGGRAPHALVQGLMERAGTATAAQAGSNEEGRSSAPPVRSVSMCGMHSPGGGAPQLMQPPCSADSRPFAFAPQSPPGVALSPQCAATPQPQLEQFLAYLRTHEYSHYMSHYMAQGATEQQARVPCGATTSA